MIGTAIDPRPELWPGSGFRLLARDPAGHLAVTDDFLRAYLARPELAPAGDASAAERALHAKLRESPRAAVAAAEIDRLADADARDNYRAFLPFRDRLVAAGTVEGCYMGLFREGAVSVPPLFVDQMAHVILRNALDGTDDPFRARAAELFFRTQTATLEQGAVLLGDTEVVEMLAAGGGMGSLGRLVTEQGTPLRRVDMDVLVEANAGTYWARNERHDMVLDLSFARPGVDALSRVIETWIEHLLKARVRVQPRERIQDPNWVWHVGLDKEATSILNDLYGGAEVEDERLKRLLALFRLDFEDPRLMRAEIAGRPIYLALAMDEGNRVRLKPQNLIANLPLAKKM